MTVTSEILPVRHTVAPSEPGDVVEAVRAARREQTPIYPIGGGTCLDYGGRPTTPGVGLSLEKLNRAIDHAADDMTVTVEAGVTIAELAGLLASKRQRLPIDVPQADRATVGGVVATNPSGPRRFAHGTVRDYVLGVRAVDGTGMPLAAGGRVVKNAAGYDLGRMLVGSLGTLAIVTEVTLMVRPLPESSAMLACGPADWAAMEGLLAALVETRTLPVGVELIAGHQQPLCPALPERSASGVARLIVGFEGSVAEVEWMVRQLRDEWRALGISAADEISAADAGPVWDWLTEWSADVQVSVRPSATVATVRHLLGLDPGCSIQAHAADGIVRVRWSSSTEDVDLVRLCTELRSWVATAGGNMALLRVPNGMPATAENVWGPSGKAAAIMRAIKERFDPDGLLNPGRFEYTS